MVAPGAPIDRVQLTDDGGIIKEILSAGDGSADPLYPVPGDTVEVDYTGTLIDGTVFDSSKNPGRDRFTFVLGKGQVIKGWDVGVASMRKGERCRLLLEPEYAYGSNGAPPSIPPNAKLIFEVELHGWKEAADLVGDGSVKKYVESEGDKDKKWIPKDGDDVHLCFLEDPKADAHDTTVNFTVGDTANSSDVVPAGMHVAVKTMRLNETARIVMGGQSKYVRLTRILRPEWIKEKTLRLIHLEEVAGIWRKPNAGSKVKLGVSWEEGGKECDTSFEFETEAGEVPEAFDLAAMHMQETETAVLMVHDVACVEGCPEGLRSHVAKMIDESGSARLATSLEKLQRAKETWEMSDEERVEAAKKAKDLGNQAWKRGDVDLAAARWERAKECLSSRNDLPSDAKELLKAINLNLSAAYLKLQEPRKAKKLLDEIISADPYCLKALFRRAEAFMATKDYVEARLDLKTATGADPENADLKKLEKRLCALEASEARRAQAVYSRMFK